MNTVCREVRRPRYVPQSVRVADYLKANPGSYIRDIEVALRIPFDSARVVVDGLLRKGAITRGARGPLSAVPFFAAVEKTESPSADR